jgi:hypothetical protein
MIIPIPGNVRLIFPVNEVEVDETTFSLEDGKDNFTVSYSFRAGANDGSTSATLRGTVPVTKEAIAAEAGKTFDKATVSDIRRAIRKAVVDHVKAKL